MTEGSGPDAARDEKNLQALRRARAAGDDAGEREALAHLIAPYWEWGRSIAYAKIDGVPNRQADAVGIAQELIVRLVKALNRKLHFDAPFHVVAIKNLRWAIGDYWRDRGREEAFPLDPGELPEALDTEEIAAATEQAHAFAPYLDGLSKRERELVTERIFLDITPAQIASRHGMSRAAVDTALHRALKKLRQSRQLEDVRNRTVDTA